MNRVDDMLSAHKTVSKEQAEEIEPGCTNHTTTMIHSPTGAVYVCHARLGIKWRVGA